MKPSTLALRDAILAVLREADHPLTTTEVAKLAGSTYQKVYAQLRTMCGSHTMTYAEANRESVNVAGYPVIWHRGGEPSYTTTWEVTGEEDDPDLTADLEALWVAPALGETAR